MTAIQLRRSVDVFAASRLNECKKNCRCDFDALWEKNCSAVYFPGFCIGGGCQ